MNLQHSVTVALSWCNLCWAPLAPMDPQYVRALRDAKSLLDDGIFSEKEFEEQKEILKQRFHVSQPGVPPAAPVAVPFHVSQPGVPPAAPAPAPAPPRHGMSDSECRDAVTGRYLWNHRKCCKCPPDTCFLHISQFSPEQKKNANAKTRLCLQHEASQGQSCGSSSFQTPSRAPRRMLGTAMNLCSPRAPRAALDALDIPETTTTTGHGGFASLSGGPSGGGSIIPAAIHPASSTAVSRGFDVSGATATGSGRMLLGSAGFPSSVSGFPSSVSYSYAIPMRNTSQAPRSLATRSTTTIPMRLPPTPADVPILDVDEEDVLILDVCHAAGCGSTSSAMKKCQHCQKFAFCSKRCARQCPCSKHDHVVSGPSRIDDLLNPVAVSSSCPPLPETNTVSCPYCGSDMDVHMGTCSFCYEQYCSRYCIPTFLDVTCVLVPVFRLDLLL